MVAIWKAYFKCQIYLFISLLTNQHKIFKSNITLNMKVLFKKTLFFLYVEIDEWISQVHLSFLIPECPADLVYYLKQLIVIRKGTIVRAVHYFKWFQRLANESENGFQSVHCREKRMYLVILFISGPVTLTELKVEDMPRKVLNSWKHLLRGIRH